MSPRRSSRHLLVAVLLGVLVGGGLMAVTPAGAQVNEAVATSWKKIWKKEIRPRADRRYYTKAQGDAKYQAKGSYETAGSGYSKAETDARYQPKGNYALTGSSYTKAESDAKYAPYPTVIRGVWHIALTASVAGEASSDHITFGYTLPAAPTVHYIEQGAALPTGCAGTAAAPDAAPGHLCVFETYEFGTLTTTGIYDLAANAGASTLGAVLGANTDAAGRGRLVGTWAVRPGTVSSSKAAKPGPSAD